MDDMRMMGGGRGRGRRRGRRGGRGMDYGYGMPHGRGMDYGYDMRGSRMMDGHHYPEQPIGGQTYYPIEAMGRFNGYWGVPEQEYGRGRDYGYPHRYGRMDYGDYGENLSDEELRHWEGRLLAQLDDRERQMFAKETIMQKARSLGKPMDGFGEKEMYVATLMVYTDYKNSIGANPDLAVKLAYDWLADRDVEVKGAEKLAVYYDCIVEGEDD